jgi:hypothetical protein
MFLSFKWDGFEQSGDMWKYYGPENGLNERHLKACFSRCNRLHLRSILLKSELFILVVALQIQRVHIQRNRDLRVSLISVIFSRVYGSVTNNNGFRIG